MPRFPDHPVRRPALVTGASSGIGEATARALAGAGHPVVLAARRLDRCETTAAQIRAAGGEATALRLDLADPASIKDVTAGAEDAYGPLEAVISNAGDTLIGRAHETEPTDFAAQVQVNLLGVQQLVSLVVPGMIERRRGDLVFVSTDAVPDPRPGIASYIAAKWGLEGMARAMQMELEGTGVRASIVRPGPTMTEMAREWDPGDFARLVEEWVRWGVARHDSFLRPAQVASAVLGVVSMPRGAHVTLLQVEPEAPITSVPEAPHEQSGRVT